MIKNLFLDFARCLLGPIKRWINRNKAIRKCPNVKIMYGSDVTDTVFDKHGFVAHHAQLFDVTVGNYSSIGRYCKIRSADIGKYCSISWDVTIGAVEHPLTRISTAALTYKAEFNVVPKDVFYPQKRTIIGNDVWIGCNSIIRSGIKVGDGAVIGAGSVCVKDVPPYAIVAGNPAKMIRMRMEPELAQRVNDLKWWDWPTEDIKKNIDCFSVDISVEVVEKLEEYNKTRISMGEKS